jgi:hypothetical protein
LNQRKELKIRGWKSEVGQFLGPHPSQFIAAQWLWRAAEPRTIEQMKGDGLGLIVMTDLNKLLEGLHPHPQFFSDFSFKTGFQALSRLLLAARELPVPCKMAALRPLRDEELPLFPD